VADVNLEGNVVEDIFSQAINTMPNGASAIARMIASKKRRRPLNNQQLFKKTMKAMQNMNVGKEEDILKYATREYLQKHFGLPACDTSAYDVKIRRGKITLKYKPNSPGSIPFAFWINKHKFDGQKISDVQQTRTFTKLTPDEVVSKLTENSKWLEQKDIYKQRIAQMYNTDSNQLAEIFKDNVPNRADFTGCEISNFDFSKYDLSSANLKGARLDNCVISKMENANLTDAVIDGCIFTGANLAASDFQKANISNTTFDKADLRGCDFNQSVPQDVTFRDAIFKGTKLDFAKAQNVVFESVNNAGTAKESTQGRETGKPRATRKSKLIEGTIEEPTGKTSLKKTNNTGKEKTKGQNGQTPAALEAAATGVKTPSKPKAPAQPPISM
jgi:uncharacterized protein YjbI with pentapeptide repeats